MKRWMLLGSLAVGGLLLAACGKGGDSGDSAKEKKIGIIQYVEHASLDDARKGFIDGLKEHGYEGDNVTIDEQNAQGDQANLKSIGEKLVNNKNDLILAIATPAAQSVMKETQDIPILFTAVTDAVEAGIVADNDKPNGNVSGTVDMGPIDKQVALLVNVVGKEKKFGIIYTSNEDNSRIQSEMAAAEFKKLGIKPKVMTVANSTEVQQAMETLSAKVDGIFVPTDNNFASTMTTVGKVAQEKKVVVVPGSIGQVDDGALATIGIDYYKLGKQTADMAVKVFEGEEIGSLAVERPKGLDLHINEDMAKTLGIDVESIKMPE
ncbi:ABC transporter substrate-binding protein [Vagococcus acidifermentans]|nr:ABC transporter substrate-binding protein [Vagococcus acidifermentans]